MISADARLMLLRILISSGLLLTSPSFGQRQPIFGGAVCYSLNDLQETIDKAASLPPQAFKAYWDTKKATGKCLFVAPEDAPSGFQIEDANVSEKEYETNGKSFRAIVVRGRVGSVTGPIGFSFLQFEK
jgi:hypothetical protein